MSKTNASIILMFTSALIGFFIGAFDGAILCTIITGIPCIVYAIDKNK